MLPERYRMTRSNEFGGTVKHGVRAAERDLVIHVRRCDADDEAGRGPRFGLVVSRSVGTAVQRHRVARRLRHVARTFVAELQPSDRIVVRALPGSRHAISAGLEQQIRSALTRAGLLSARSS